MKYLQTLSVVVLGLPCLDITTCLSFSGCGTRVSKLLESLSTLRRTFVPFRHVVFLLCLVFSFPRVLIQILLLAFSFHCQIMAEFAFLALLAIPLLIEYAQHGLRIHTKRNLLDLDRLK